MLTPTNLLVNYKPAPLGIDTPAPRFSWETTSAMRGDKQTAYQVQCGSVAGGADLWDTGQVAGGAQNQIAYAGSALTSRQVIYWQVRVWDVSGNGSTYAASTFEMGLIAASNADWTGSFIGFATGSPTTQALPSPLLRKEFALTAGKTVLRARLYTTGLGLYQPRLNGAAASDGLRMPGWTNYTTTSRTTAARLHYQTFDVTSQLSANNCLGFELGDGWYVGWHSNVGLLAGSTQGRSNYDQNIPYVLGQLVITFTDGSTQTIVTDTSWKAVAGPTRTNDIWLGTSYDARLEQSGWDVYGFNASSWSAVTTATNTVQRTAQVQPLTRRQTPQITPVSVTSVGGKWVFDMGQVMTGHTKLTLTASAGTTIVLKHAEAITAGTGAITQASLGTSPNMPPSGTTMQTTQYICKGGGSPEVFEPKFTYASFRYVEMTGWPSGTPPLSALTGIQTRCDAAQTSTLVTSSSLVNSTYANALNSLGANMQGTFTDTSGRERYGWTADALVSTRALLTNYDCAAFIRQFVQCMNDSQSSAGLFPDTAPLPITGYAGGNPGWIDAGIMMPWRMYQLLGDTEVLAACYTQMQAQLSWYAANTTGFLVTAAHYGDYNPAGSTLVATSDTGLASNSFYALSVLTMSKIAMILGHTADAATYTGLYQSIKSAFQAHYCPSGLFSNSFITNSEVQAAYTLAYEAGLLPAKINNALGSLFQASGGNQNTGLLGTGSLHMTLKNLGLNALMWAALNKSTAPSYANMIARGATSLWENWDADTLGISQNHHVQSAILGWFFRVLAGIDIDEAAPGYKHIIMKPYLAPGLTSVSASAHSIYGTISSAWTLDTAGNIVWNVSLPPGTTALISIPTKTARSVYEGGVPASQVGGLSPAGWSQDASGQTFGNYNAQSGNYAFTISTPPAAATTRRAGSH